MPPKKAASKPTAEEKEMVRRWEKFIAQANQPDYETPMDDPKIRQWYERRKDEYYPDGTPIPLEIVRAKKYKALDEALDRLAGVKPRK